MSICVGLAHDDLAFLRCTAFALRNAGYDVEVFDNSMSALNRLDRPEYVDVLVTRTRFPLGQPNGIALAHMAGVKKPGIKIVIAVVEELAGLAEGLGIVLRPPVTPAEVVEAVLQAMSRGC
jgi:DNA-binding NtrC family response regulator